MSYKSLTVQMVILCLVAHAAATLAQETESTKIFKLLRDTAATETSLNLEDEEIEAWRPGLEAGSIELSFSLGMLGLDHSLLRKQQVIYKYTSDFTYWGDIEVTGETSFNPVLRIGYNLQKWFALEGQTGMSFGQYTTSITDRKRRSNEIGSLVDEDEPALGEFDAEERSLITLQASLNAVLYPLAITGSGAGKWQPYLTAGAGRIWYDMNSNYTDGMTGSFDINFGGGVRLLADRNISLRAEVIFRRNTLEWTPSPYFTELDEGTVLVPLNEYPIMEDGSFVESEVTEFESTDLSLLGFSLGFQGSF